MKLESWHQKEALVEFKQYFEVYFFSILKKSDIVREKSWIFHRFIKLVIVEAKMTVDLRV